MLQSWGYCPSHEIGYKRGNVRESHLLWGSFLKTAVKLG